MKKSKPQLKTFTQEFLTQPPLDVVEFFYSPPDRASVHSSQWRLWEGRNIEGKCIWSICCPYKIGGWVKEVNPILVDGCWFWEVTTS